MSIYGLQENNWHPAFVGHCTFQTALENCEAKHKEKPKGQELIEHFKYHIEQLNNQKPYRPLTVEARSITKQLFGDKALNKVYSAGNTYIPLESTQGALQREDQGKQNQPSADDIVNNAFDITNTTVEFYKNVHGKDLNALLGESATHKLPLVSIVHYGGKNGTKKGYDNAFFSASPAEMVYGDGNIFKPLVGEPTVGIHEISHMVTQETGGTHLNKNGQPTGIDYTADAGGINEFNSDAGAIAALQRQKNKLPKDNDCPWRIGQGLFRSNPSYALRDMSQPGNGYQNDKYLGDDPQAGFDNYRNWFQNAEKVDPHLSSAVGNKWYYLTAIHLDGPTWDTVEKIRIAVLPDCPADVTYPHYAQLTIKAAKQLHPETDNTWQIVADAWKQVEVLL